MKLCLSLNMQNFSDRTICKNVQNKNYENDINRTFQYTRWLFNFLGVWPVITRYSSEKSKYFSIFVILFGLSMISFTMLPATLHTILHERNPHRRLILIGPVSATFASFLKYNIIILRANTIKSCVEKIEKDWMTIVREDERAIMTKNATVGRHITILCSLFMYTGGMSYHTIMPIVKGARINEFNVTMRPLVYPGYDIFVEPQASPTYETIFFLTCVSAFVRYTVSIAICSLAAVFVSHACGQIDIVMSRLNTIFDDIIDEKRNMKKIETRISVIIRYHARGLRLSTSIDEGMREILLIEVMASTLCICLLEYDCLTEWQNSEPVGVITYFILLISYIFNIFIFCHIGELLQEQYHTVGKAAYMIEWYRLPGKHGLALIMVMAMASYPRKITAGRMMDLSVRNFSNIIKTSVTYLNMLRATTN